MIYLKLFWTFVKIGLCTLGSGYSMLVLAQRYVVDSYGWLTAPEFVDLVALAEVTPGPLIVNLSTFVGAKVAGFRGALSSTVGLILFPFIILYIIALTYGGIRQHPLGARLLAVVRPMAIGLIAVAIINLVRTSVTDIRAAVIVAVVVVLTAVCKVSPVAIVAAGVIYALLVR